MSPTYDRDLIGYGGNPPDPKWPNGARLAVNFVINYEEGSEPSIQDGEGYTETGLTDGGAVNPGIEGRNLAGESLFNYGSRVGFWRLMRLFQERDLPLTIFGCALALERNPKAVEAIRQSGFDVCSHGWRWIQHYRMTESEEREQINKAVTSLKRMLGERPLGWYCRYSPSVNTRRLLVEEGGFLYDSDAYDDELPYWVKVGDQPHLVVPYTLTNNDTQFGRSNIGTSEQFFEVCRDAFDVLYHEGKTQPKMMSIGLHMRLMGHPARAAGLQRLLDYMNKHAGVWITKRIDIAQHWREHHPWMEN